VLRIVRAREHRAAGQHGAHDAAQAEEPMKRRHDRPAHAVLDRRRLGVHGDVEQAVTCAQDP